VGLQPLHVKHMLTLFYLRQVLVYRCIFLFCKFTCLVFFSGNELGDLKTTTFLK